MKSKNIAITLFLLLVITVVSSITTATATTQASGASAGEDLKQKLKLHISHFFEQKEKNKQETIKPLQQWIQEASLPEHEQGIQKLVHHTLQHKLQMDFVDMWTMDEQKQELSEHPDFVNPRSWESLSKSPNVVGFWLSDENDNKQGAAVVIDAKDASQHTLTTSHKDSKTIILNGHVDVVPVGADESAWINGNAFSGDYNETTDRVYGRGTTDMKGGNFANLLALESIQHALSQVGMKRLPKTTIVYQSVVEEESGGAGTLAAVLRHRHMYPSEPSNQCIGIATEPTQLKLFTAQQGSMWFRITVLGKQAHGGTRYLGISALEHAVFVIQTLQRLEAERNANLKVPVPINIGKINGGDWPSSVPDRVVLEGRIGVIPNPMETLQQAKDALREALENSPEMKQHNVRWELEFFGARWPPAFCPAEHSFIDHLKSAYVDVQSTRPESPDFEKEAVVSSSPWATDAGYLYHVGKCPSVVFGPGDTALAHQLHETVKVDNIFRVAEVLARSIIDFSLSEQ